MEESSECAVMAQDPFQKEDSVRDSFTLDARVSLCICGTYCYRRCCCCYYSQGNFITPAYSNFNMQTACEDRLAEIQERKEKLHEYSANLESAHIAAGQHLSAVLVARCVCFPHAAMQQ